MNHRDTGGSWKIGDIGDPGLQHWLRKKVKTHLFITQDRIERDDLIQDLNLHLLETLSEYPSSDKTWPHFCRSQVFRKINQNQRPRRRQAPAPKPEETEAPAPTKQKRPERAVPRPDPRLRLSRLLGSQPIEEVAKQTGIPAKTLRGPIAKMKQAMKRRYPKIYGAAEPQQGYRGEIRWNPISTLPQPRPPEPAPEGVVLWLKPNKKTDPAKPTKSTQKPKPKQAKPQAKKQAIKPKQTQPQSSQKPKQKPSNNRAPTQKRSRSKAHQTRLEKKRAQRRLARPRRPKTKQSTERLKKPPKNPKDTPDRISEDQRVGMPRTKTILADCPTFGSTLN